MTSSPAAQETTDFPVRVRARISQQGYTPGARSLPQTAATVRVCRLASNEAALGPLPEVLIAMADEEAIHRYPDPTARILREAIAEHADVSIDQVAVGAGSVGLIDHLLRLVAGDGDDIVVGGPSFGAYTTLSAPSGTRTVKVPLAGSAMDLPAMAQAITSSTRAVFVCTPNNPTGGSVSARDLRAFVAEVPANVLVVVDEAYHEFVTSDDPVSGVDLLTEHRNVVVLRTFSKAHGLAGLRVGYAVGDPELIRAISSLQPPFAVSAPAQAAATISLRHHQAVMARVADVVTERARILDAARAAGLTAPDSDGNFVWLPVPDVAAANAALANAGVLARPFAGAGLRITVGTPEENDQLIAALADLRPEVLTGGH